MTAVGYVVDNQRIRAHVKSDPVYALVLVPPAQVLRTQADERVALDNDIAAESGGAFATVQLQRASSQIDGGLVQFIGSILPPVCIQRAVGFDVYGALADGVIVVNHLHACATLENDRAGADRAGATGVIHVRVQGAGFDDDRAVVARAVALEDKLFRTALGERPAAADAIHEIRVRLEIHNRVIRQTHRVLNLESVIRGGYFVDRQGPRPRVECKRVDALVLGRSAQILRAQIDCRVADNVDITAKRRGALAAVELKYPAL